jgi:hypothetical protein
VIVSAQFVTFARERRRYNPRIAPAAIEPLRRLHRSQQPVPPWRLRATSSRLRGKSARQRCSTRRDVGELAADLKKMLSAVSYRRRRRIDALPSPPLPR